MSEPLADLGETHIPSFLPNPQRVAIAAFDKWCRSTTSTNEEKRAVVEALSVVFHEIHENCPYRIESIPMLIQLEDPTKGNITAPHVRPSEELLLM